MFIVVEGCYRMSAISRRISLFSRTLQSWRHVSRFISKYDILGWSFSSCWREVGVGALKWLCPVPKLPSNSVICGLVWVTVSLRPGQWMSGNIWLLLLLAVFWTTSDPKQVSLVTANLEHLQERNVKLSETVINNLHAFFLQCKWTKSQLAKLRNSNLMLKG